MNKRDYYEVLGVSKTATDAEIKSAFRKMAKKYHPDVSKEPDAATKFKEAQEAYAVLSDPQKRQQYDQFGHAAFNQGGAGSPGFDFSDFDFSDIFGDLFGGGFGGFGFGGSNKTNRPKKGRDKLLRVNLTFEEAIFGTKKTINIDLMEQCEKCSGKGGFQEKTCESCHGSGYVTSEQRTLFGSFMSRSVCPKCQGVGKSYETACNVCHGTGHVKKNKDIEVKIPAGVDTGNQLRIPAKGEAGLNGGPNGDIYLEFVVKEHPLFERKENDIYLTLPITIPEAVLGTKKEVPTLYGKVKLTINAGTSTNDKYRLKGKGVEDVQTGKKGDMYAIIRVVIPKKLTKGQKLIFEQLEQTGLDDDSAFHKIKEYL